MIYITGDIHGQWDLREPFIRGLSSTDILITLGDWGWCWSPLHFQGYLELNPSCLQLWIDGNHENFDYLNTFPIVELFGGKAHKLANNIYHLMRGEMYEIEGKKFFVFGGALSIDKAYRRPYISWWPEEQPSKADYQHALQTLEKNNWTFDFLLTHTCEDDLAKFLFGYKDIIKDSTSRMIQELKHEITIQNGSFLKHFFGHHHQFARYFGENSEIYALYTEVYCLNTGEINFY